MGLVETLPVGDEKYVPINLLLKLILVQKHWKVVTELRLKRFVKMSLTTEITG